PTFGFRLVKNTAAVPDAAFAPITWPYRDLNKEKPVPDSVFEAFKRAAAENRSNESVRFMGHLGPLASSRTCICLVCLILSLDALAQVQNGEINGTVTDPSGAVLPGAKIVLQNLGTHYEIHARTNAEGIYTAKELNVGNYLVRVEAQGFKT